MTGFFTHESLSYFDHLKELVEDEKQCVIERTEAARKMIRYVQVSSILIPFFLENPVSIFALPAGFITSFFISLAVSAASTAANIGISYLLREKPKPVDKNKLQGDIKLSTIGEDLFINEIYGERDADLKGGVKVGGVLVYASPIRLVTEVVPGGGGGGKGPRPRANPERRHHYYQDFAFIVGRGPLRVLSIEAGGSNIYQDIHAAVAPGHKTEAESGTVAGGASKVNDPDCSGTGNNKVTGLGLGGTVTLSGVEFLGASQRLWIAYKSTADSIAVVTISGTDYEIPLANSYDAVYWSMIEVEVPEGTHTVVIGNPTAAMADIDRISVQYIVVPIDPHDPPDIPPPGPAEYPPYLKGHVSGIRMPDYVNPSPTYDNISLVDPLSVDLRAYTEFNYQPKPDTDGMIEALLPSMTIRIYPGTQTQLPDPMLQAHFENLYGTGATPAFRGRALVVIENMETTDYGGYLPAMTFRLENMEKVTLEDLYLDRAERAGIDVSEMDFSAFSDIHLKGYVITQQQSPSVEMRVLNRIFDVDVYEGIEGTIKGVVPDETVVATIPLEELGVKELSSIVPEEGNPPFLPVEVTYGRDEEIPYYLDAGFFNADNDGEVANVHALREVTVSNKKASIETGLVMTKSEAQRFVNRDLQRAWAEKDVISCSTFWKYAYLEPTSLIEVEDEDGTITPVRLRSVEGWVPGVFSLTGVSRDVSEVSPRPSDTVADTLAPEVTPGSTFALVHPPAHVIGTIVNISILRKQEKTLGFYAGCALTNQHYRWGNSNGAALYWEREGQWEFLTSFDAQATIGRTIASASLSAPPGGLLGTDFDEVNDITVDLFYGEVDSVTSAQALARNNAIVIGNEVIGVRDSVRDSDYDRRFTFSGLLREQFNTLGSGHATDERVVVMNTAMKYIEIDESEIGKTRTYKFVATGQPLESASSFEFTFTKPTNYDITNLSELRSMDATSVTLDDLASVVGTVIEDSYL